MFERIGFSRRSARPVMSAVTVAAEDSQADVLSLLPPALLSAILLLLRCPTSLLRLAACSRALLESVTHCEEVWQLLCVARQWDGGALHLSPSQSVSFYVTFCDKRRRLCVDCGQPTPYVHVLLNRRLCERCEAASPLYALVTAAQAGELGASLELLSSLPCKEVRGVLCRGEEKRLRAAGQGRLYLRVQVEQQVAAHKAAGLRARRSEQQFQIDDLSAEETQAETEAEEEDPGFSEASERKFSAAEAKAARKEAKAAVKASNRDRRAAKSAGTSGQSPHSRSCGASPLLQRFAVDATPSASARKAGKAMREGGRCRSFESTPRTLATRAQVEEALGAFAISGLELRL